MKPFYSFLAALCLFLNANAQENITNNGIRIGQTVPDILITNVSGLQLKNKPVRSFRFSQLKGKFIILDFWATWCAPCRKMAPVLDSLQKQFGDQVLFIQVAYESATTVAPVQAAMQRIKPYQLPSVTSDVVLNQLFPHRSLPHFVWIDRDGVVKAITEEKEVNARNIQKMLSGENTTMLTKRDSVSPYSPAQPLLIAGNGGDGTGFVYHSLLTRYKPGLNSGTSISPYDETSGQRFTARNVPFPWLCRLAYSEKGRAFPPSRTLILTRDTPKMDTGLSGQAFNSWLASGNGWCYELALPPQLATSAWSMMQADLARLFPQYQADVEKRRMRCLALVRTGTDDKLRSRGGEHQVAISPFKAVLRNAHLSQLMMRLERQYLQNSPLPVVDATHYTGRVDLSIDARLDNVQDLNRALAPYGLAFKEQEEAAEVLVIRDAKVNTK
ncbi:MAG: TlpA disulfide reductase family protein [Mucilaginibacter sp.]|jgi:thiol-disulfide isomerase/thioredoxin|uniref:TlpA family protein disulfide reductase n=1 Tax=Mucilaginibacter sp. TaxID=1882438 RepID=UPI00356286ED